MFMDSVHLSNAAAGDFSPVIFADIREYIASRPGGSKYVLRGDPPRPGPWLRGFEPGTNPPDAPGSEVSVSSSAGTSP